MSRLTLCGNALLFCFSAVSFGQESARTSDGKEVLLFPDGRWTYASTVVDDPPVAVQVLLSSTDKPIHIGDGRGKIGDIKEKHPEALKSFPPNGKSWEVEIQTSPKRARLAVAVFSVEGRGEVDCPTVLLVNDKQVYDLRDARPVGRGTTTRAKVDLDVGTLVPGPNTVEIRELQCKGMTAQNDSVIEEVQLELF